MVRRRIGCLILVSVLLGGAASGFAEILAWEWPPADPAPAGECLLRRCDQSAGSTWQNLGSPCLEDPSGGTCVLAFEYLLEGRMGHHVFCSGEVAASHCGTYERDVSACAGDVFNLDGTFREAVRWKYRLMVRSVGCDGAVSDWSTHLSGDEGACADVAVGDVNADGVVDREDVIALLTYLRFSGPAPACFHAADAWANGFLGPFDAFLIFLWLPPDQREG